MRAGGPLRAGGGVSDRGSGGPGQKASAPQRPRPAPPPAAPAPRDDFDAAGGPRPKRATARGLAALEDFPFDELMELAWGEAHHRVEGPRFQHADLSVAGGVPTLKVSFHDRKLAQWYALRLSKAGELIWDRHELTRASLAARWSMVENLDGLGIRLVDLLDWVKQVLPQARFDFVGLQVRPRGRLVWLAQQLCGFPAEQVLEVDAESGEPRLWQFDAGAGRHLVV